MSRDLDELFGPSEHQPTPRIALVWGLLVGGLVLTVAGLACSTVPGGVLVLVALALVDTEQQRVTSGYLSERFEPRLARIKALVWVALVAVLVLFTIQLTLLGMGFYPALWIPLVELVAPGDALPGA